MSLRNNGLYRGKHWSSIYRGNPCHTSGWIPLWCCKRICPYQIRRTASNDRNTCNPDYFRGIAEIVLGSGGSISVTNTEGFAALGGKVGRVPYILFLVLILGIIAAVILGKCTFGRRVYAIGTNRLAAYYSGIHVQKIRFVIYTLMGTISGLCALFLMSSSFGANTTTGNGFEMDAIAMAVFGGISSTGGKGNIAGGLISAFIIVCLRVGLGQRNIHPQVILLIIGVLLIGAVALPNVIKEIQKKAKTAK